MSVSQPGSKDYGKHWTHERVKETFSPSRETVEKVVEWLVSEGFETEGIRRPAGGGWVEFEGSVADVERLLSARYWVWEHEEGQRHVACEEYFVPE